MLLVNVSQGGVSVQSSDSLLEMSSDTLVVGRTKVPSEPAPALPEL